jgi:DNA-binding phage protein
MKKTKAFGQSKRLNNPDDIACFIDRALKTGDLQVITQAIGVSAKARGM